MNQKSSSKLILIITVAVIFGLGAGVVGQILARVYLMSDAYNIPLFGEVNFANTGYNGSNLVISGARKVVVEQDTKVLETINSSKGSIVGIFNKVESEVEASNYYVLNNELGSGFILTSDGWIVTNALDKKLEKQFLIENFVVINNAKKIFLIDDVILDDDKEFTYVHVTDAKDLPVQEFGLERDVASGKIAVIPTWDNNSLVTFIVGKQNNSEIVRSSDNRTDNILVSDALSKDFEGAVVNDLSGKILGLVTKDLKIKPIYHFNSALKSLLKNNQIERASLGVNYINLSELAYPDFSDKKGALISTDSAGVSVLSNSPAEMAGLKLDDIIISVNNVEINQDNDLGIIMRDYLKGDVIDIVYLRNNERFEISVKL